MHSPDHLCSLEKMAVGNPHPVVDDTESGAAGASTPSSLEEPLLPRTQSNTLHSSGFAGKETTNDAGPESMRGSWSVPLHRIKILSFVTGALVAVASQLILSQILWKPSHVTSSSSSSAAAVDGATNSTRSIVAFSLLWSFCTCVMIFGSMAVFVKCVCRSFFRNSNTTKALRSAAAEPKANEGRRSDLDGDLFQIEAHHIVGSLLSISFIWIVVDVCQSLSHSQPSSSYGGGGWGATARWGLPTLHQNFVYMAIAAAWYAVFVRCLTRAHSHDAEAEAASRPTGLMSTYQMIAATLGLISGLCSQFLLSFVLWRDHMSKPVVENVIAFSILWSVCSVFLTFVGCVSLRLLTLDEANRLSAERIFLRMESHFIFCSLIGICLAWILIDLIMDMREQIVPSVLMLAVSLLAFCGIVSCFPEEKCLADLQDLNDIQLTETTTTTPSNSDDDVPVIQIV
jgi:hypothetical protein